MMRDIMMLTDASVRGRLFSESGSTRRSNFKYISAVFISTLALTSGSALAGCLVNQPKTCAPTINAQGQVGRTSYDPLPFASSIFAQSWGSSPGLAPANLFWQQGSNFTNAQTMTAARQYAAKLTTKG